MRYVGATNDITEFRRKRVRALILATLAATGLATVALAAGDNNSSIIVKAPAPAAATPPAPPLAPAPVPVVTTPPPAPVPAVVQAPWPENVPSFKPGTGGTTLASAKPAAPAAPATAAGQSLTANQTATATQTASLPPTPIPSGPPTKVALQASIMQGGKPLRDPLIWTVSVPQPGTVNKPGTQVATQSGPKAEFQLPQGTYVVTVKDAEAIVNSVLIVGAAPITKVIPLNISAVGVKMIPYTGAKLITQPIHWEVFNSALGKPGPNSKIADVNAPQSIFTLAAGFYVVRAQYSDIHADLAILIEPGITYSYTVDLYAASVAAKVVDHTGKAPKGDVSWEVIRTAADAAGQHQVVATDIGASPEFLLREGMYMVIATAADGSKGQTPVVVRAGQASRITVKLAKAGTNG
jgi:hypothetical protein